MTLFGAFSRKTAALKGFRSDPTSVRGLAAELSEVAKGSAPKTIRGIIGFMAGALRRSSVDGSGKGDKQSTTPGLNQCDLVLLRHINDRMTVAVAHESNRGTFKHPLSCVNFSQAKHTIEVLVGDQTCRNVRVAASKGANSDSVRELLQPYVDRGHIKVEFHSAAKADLFKIEFVNARPS